jgi:dethiobiotin synthetase
VATLFVTSAGTDVGKTFTAVRLIAELRAAGRRVRALKPIASGFDAAAPETSDTARLLRALDLAATPANLDAVSPWRFAAPLSPDMAAEREGRRIAFDEVVDFCRAPAPGVDVTLIEGIGGVMVPLDERHTVLDLIAALGAPALLVVGGYLGTLSHTLTAAAVLRARRCELAGVVVNASPEQPVPSEATAATLERFLAPTPVAVQARHAHASGSPLLERIGPLLGRR